MSYKTSMPLPNQKINNPSDSEWFTAIEVMEDYKWAVVSRCASYLGRKEVLTGKAKFGIFGDGKEVPQLALARVFQWGDFRSGYYRDQTFIFSAGLISVKQFFSQLYANPSVEADPSSGGRSMNCHFATRLLNEDGTWKNQLHMKNTAADLSPTAAQTPKLVGLAYASKLYKNNPELTKVASSFSNKGREVAFGTIGDASTSEGLFWESMNAAAVLQVPLVMCVWDDGYGISVPTSLQTAKGSISQALAGMSSDDLGQGIRIFTVKGWDYPSCRKTFSIAAKHAREHHQPVLIHVVELTQPQGHSSSGSHERYKSPERLAWEGEFDCLGIMRRWILEKGYATENEIENIESDARCFVEDQKKSAWDDYTQCLEFQRQKVLDSLNRFSQKELIDISSSLQSSSSITRKFICQKLQSALITLWKGGHYEDFKMLKVTYDECFQEGNDLYSTFLYPSHVPSPLDVAPVKPIFTADSPWVDGRLVLLKCFEENFQRDPRIFSIGEDIGYLGDVNLVYEGLINKFGPLRITDTGIREATILGQGIGAAMRGLRPIIDIQYLDYILYALQGLSDDLATLSYRSCGGQNAPVIVRTKGHRLEGIWHAGSPMGVLVHALRGIHICVPRDMTQAAGMYNALLRGEHAAIVVEVLNGYRLKERLPSHPGQFFVPLGLPEVLMEGHDITVVTYGACCGIAQEAAKKLKDLDIFLEVIDVQTLLPFDTSGVILKSIMKTHGVIFFDEDVPGGASAYMMQKVIEEQKAFDYLELPPRTLSAASHRTAYGTDGDYFSKPNVEQLVLLAVSMVRQRKPHLFFNW